MSRAWKNKYGSVEWTDAQYLEKWKSRCIITASGCWEWQGFCFAFRNMKPGQRGYPSASYRGYASARLHRVIATWNAGRPLTSVEVAMHKCDNPPCINPEHLTHGTQSQNKLDELAKGRSFYANKTHCKRGHEFTTENTEHTLNPKGRPRRACKACQMGNHRIKAGWPERLAYSLPAQQLGYRPPSVRNFEKLKHAD